MSEPVEPATETPTETPDAAAQQPKEVDWESEAKKWEKRSKDNFAKLKEAEPKLAEYDQLKKANQSESERLAEEATRWQTEAQRWQSTAVGSTITALAASDFADPSDAAAALNDPAKYLDAGGQINEDAIRKDLAAVLERKPHWRRSEGTTAPRVPAPNPHQGSGGNGKSAADPATEFGAIIQRQLNGAG